MINLPSTVQLSMPHDYASQIEYMSKNLKYGKMWYSLFIPITTGEPAWRTRSWDCWRERTGLREPLFGNGERTGNVDIVTLAMNMYSQGVDPRLDFSNMPISASSMRSIRVCRWMRDAPTAGRWSSRLSPAPIRTPLPKACTGEWKMIWTTGRYPICPLIPQMWDANYDADVIRINSQSGKGGVGYILEKNYGLNLPPKMREAMGYAAKDLSDHLHKELHPDEIYSLFKQTFENINKPYTIDGVHFKQLAEGRIEAEINTKYDGGEFHKVYAEGNGRLNAVSNAIKKAYNLKFDLMTYQEHALSQSSSSKAIAYVGLKKPDGSLSWGAGVDPDIIRASIDALLTAVNNM